ncbi:MAG: ATP-binding protein [Planctomycetaceae bacterium]
MPIASSSAVKHFDLNIDKILENWELSHALRELIANAIDESVITNTPHPELFKDANGWWHIRDHGRGLHYQHLIQSENPEKLESPAVIGKFGIGLKDALATFDRKDIRVLIRSPHGDISLSKVTKHSFDDLVTLHATVSPASIPDLDGTDCCVFGVSDADVAAAKKMFLCFAESTLIEETKFGSVHRRTPTGGVIYINGMRVADEPNFLFSYNITSLNAAIKRALNRERQNLGRTAYADRVRSILLACQSEKVAQSLSDDLQTHSSGVAHDELNWLEVQEHAVRVLNSLKPVLFINPAQLVAHPDLVEDAQSSGFQIVAVPENLSDRIRGITDVTGRPVTELRQFIEQRNASFQFSWVLPEALTPAERDVWSHVTEILDFLGGRPRIVKDIRISETMQSNPYSSKETVGLWVSQDGWIIVKRSELKSLSSFAGTLLHEAIHAKYGVSDVSRDFEHYLTVLSGTLAARLLNVTTKPAVPADVAGAESDPELEAIIRRRLERANEGTDATLPGRSPLPKPTGAALQLQKVIERVDRRIAIKRSLNRAKEGTDPGADGAADAGAADVAAPADEPTDADYEAFRQKLMKANEGTDAALPTGGADAGTAVGAASASEDFDAARIEQIMRRRPNTTRKGIVVDDYQPPPKLRGLYESSKKLAFSMSRAKQMLEIKQYLDKMRRERGMTQPPEASNSPDPRRWPSETLGSLTGAAAEAVIRGEEAGKREADAYTLQDDFEKLLRGVVNSERERMAQQDDTPRLTEVMDESKSEEREKKLDALLTEGAKSLANELHLHKQFDSTYRDQ